jgi:hypothetical protein
VLEKIAINFSQFIGFGEILGGHVKKDTNPFGVFNVSKWEECYHRMMFAPVRYFNDR